ncbi:MAG: alanine dehydrogenase [Clostridiales bacterium]|nr:alanine dehydrogenase [Clostridiales bacterium]
MKKSYGFPKMEKEINEKRGFLPSFFKELNGYDIEICLQTGYGEKMGFSDSDYLHENKQIQFTTKKNIYTKNVVIVLRAPIEAELRLMIRGSVLISMLHYATRERRNSLLQELGIVVFSMDSMVNDSHQRVVINNYETSFNGAQIAIQQSEKLLADINLERPLNIAIIGMGEIGLTVARAFKDLSNVRYKKQGNSYNGLKVTLLTRSITGNKNTLESELRHTDILVDASSRSDTSKHIVSNKMLSELPSHSVILDITADPYDYKKNPPQVKAIEGILTGTLDQMIFDVTDKAYENLDESICKLEKRLLVSCNAWPGVNPVKSQEIYGLQLLPIIKVLIDKGHENLSLNSKNYYERILYRSSFEHFENISS